MGDLKNPKVIVAKGFLFVFLGLLAAAALLLRAPSLMNALLLSITVWAFCRSYYFAFYVIEHYVDSKYRFAGLWDFAKYMLRAKQSAKSRSGVPPL